MDKLNWDEQALRDARKIGEMLKEKHNIQPSTDDSGIIIPPPVFSDIKLSQLGKSTQVY